MTLRLRSRQSLTVDVGCAFRSPQWRAAEASHVCYDGGKIVGEMMVHFW
jgi:hypothetical protein